MYSKKQIDNKPPATKEDNMDFKNYIYSKGHFNFQFLERSNKTRVCETTGTGVVSERKPWTKKPTRVRGVDYYKAKYFLAYEDKAKSEFWWNEKKEGDDEDSDY